MGLDRVGEVARRLGIGKPGKHVVTVAGTNGKGSTVAFIEAIARAASLRVGAYTSPHLLRYNERVRIGGVDADDAALVMAFERIEAARGEIPLTYFEFGTLAALIEGRAWPDAAVWGMACAAARVQRIAPDLPPRADLERLAARIVLQPLQPL